MNDDTNDTPLLDADDLVVPNTTNSHMVALGTHDSAPCLYIGQLQRIRVHTRQEAYRLCAYVLLMADFLPNELGWDHTFEQVLDAIKQT